MFTFTIDDAGARCHFGSRALAVPSLPLSSFPFLHCTHSHSPCASARLLRQSPQAFRLKRVEGGCPARSYKPPTAAGRPGWVLQPGLLQDEDVDAG